jgi:hypothetical protein
MNFIKIVETVLDQATPSIPALDGEREVYVLSIETHESSVHPIDGVPMVLVRAENFLVWDTCDNPWSPILYQGSDYKQAFNTFANLFDLQDKALHDVLKESEIKLQPYANVKGLWRVVRTSWRIFIGVEIDTDQYYAITHAQDTLEGF